MSRTHHVLRCSKWWGTFARMYHLDNRELRRRTRHRREHDERMLMSEDITSVFEKEQR